VPHDLERTDAVTRARKPKPNASATERARSAKQKLVEHIGAATWCKGIGIAPDAHGGLALRVNVDQSGPTATELPHEVDGVAVEVVRLSGYEKREAAAKPRAAAVRTTKKKTARKDPKKRAD
jgi:hypothetical protein